MRWIYTTLLTALAVSAQAQTTQRGGYTAIISKNDLMDTDGSRHASVGKVLLQDRLNVHANGVKDADDQMDDWFATPDARSDIPQMVDLLYIPDMTKRLILLGDTKVFVRVSEAAGPPRIIGIEIAQ